MLLLFKDLKIDFSVLLLSTEKIFLLEISQFYFFSISIKSTMSFCYSQRLFAILVIKVWHACITRSMIEMNSELNIGIMLTIRAWRHLVKPKWIHRWCSALWHLKWLHRHFRLSRHFSCSHKFPRCTFLFLLAFVIKPDILLVSSLSFRSFTVTSSVSPISKLTWFIRLRW